MAEVVALDIRESAIHAVVLEGSSRRPHLKKSCSVPIASGGSTERKEMVREAIDNLFTDGKLSRDNVVVALQAHKCLLRQIWLPFKKQEQIARTVPFEIENQLPSCDLSRVVLSYAKIRETDRRSELLIAAAPREEVASCLDILSGCGIDPVAIDLDVAALYNALRRSTAQDNRNVAVADLQPDGLRIVAVEAGDLRLARGCAISPAFDPQQDAAGYFAAVAREIGRTLAAVDFQLAEDGFLITGPIAAEDGAAEALSGRLGIPVRPFDFAGELGENSGIACTVALGSGYKGLDGERLKIDFRTGDYVFKTGYEVIKRNLLLLACLAVVAFFILGQHLRRHLIVEGTEYKGRLEQAERSLWGKTVLPATGGEFKAGGLAAAIEDRLRAAAAESGPADTFTPPRRLLDALDGINRAMMQYASELNNPQLFVRNIAYRWEKEAVIINISGSFDRPAGENNWQLFKELLNKQSGLQVVEGPETSQVTLGAKEGFKVQLLCERAGKRERG